MAVADFTTADAFATPGTNADKTGTRDGESAENLSSWAARWKELQTGWHLNDVHHALLTYGNHIIPSFAEKECTDESNRVRLFVPLCGKTVDMAFLATHHGVSEVVGLDGVRRALDEFSADHPSLEIKESEAITGRSAVVKMVGKGITLLKGDYFDLDEETTGGRFDSVMDRASLVAISPELREQYVAIMGKLMRPGGSILLVTFDRREGTMEARTQGPPFSVDEAEVRRVYESADWVESVTKLDEFDVFEKDSNQKEKWASRGLSSLYELVFLIRAKK